MKRSHPETGITDKRLEPMLHFVGCFVGEGQAENTPRGYSLLDHVRNAMSDHARFAAARAGQHEQRTINVQNRFTLGRVQSIQQTIYAQLLLPNHADI